MAGVIVVIAAIFFPQFFKLRHAMLADRAQRRPLQLPLSRPGLCTRLHQGHTRGGQDRRFLYGRGRLRVGPRLSFEGGKHASPDRDAETMALLRAVGPPRLRARSSRLDLRPDHSRAIPQRSAAPATSLFSIRPARSRKKPRRYNTSTKLSHTGKIIPPPTRANTSSPCSTTARVWSTSQRKPRTSRTTLRSPKAGSAARLTKPRSNAHPPRLVSENNHLHRQRRRIPPL